MAPVSGFCGPNPHQQIHMRPAGGQPAHLHGLAVACGPRGGKPGPGGGRAYVEGTPAGDNVLARITPERWFTTDYSTLDLG